MAMLVMLAGILFFLQRAWSSLLERLWKSISSCLFFLLIGFGGVFLSKSEEMSGIWSSFIASHGNGGAHFKNLTVVARAVGFQKI